MNNKKKLSIKEIKKLIPHREPMLLVDEVEIIKPFSKAVGKKRINEDAHFFKGHFPKNPIMPGVFIIEALAQTAGIVVSENLKQYTERSVLFMSVSKAKFRKPILPNEKINFEVNYINNVKNVYKFSGIASRDNITLSEAVFSAMISYK